MNKISFKLCSSIKCSDCFILLGHALFFFFFFWSWLNSNPNYSSSEFYILHLLATIHYLPPILYMLLMLISVIFSSIILVDLRDGAHMQMGCQ